MPRGSKINDIIINVYIVQDPKLSSNLMWTAYNSGIHSEKKWNIVIYLTKFIYIKCI